MKGSVSLSGQDTDQDPITILDSTGASQYSILYDVLPFFKSVSVVLMLNAKSRN